MSVIGPPLSPKKGRWSKDKNKRALRRYRLEAAATYKKAINRKKFGTQGAASEVRQIDPTTGEPR